MLTASQRRQRSAIARGEPKNRSSASGPDASQLPQRTIAVVTSNANRDPSAPAAALPSRTIASSLISLPLWVQIPPCGTSPPPGHAPEDGPRPPPRTGGGPRRNFQVHS